MSKLVAEDFEDDFEKFIADLKKTVKFTKPHSMDVLADNYYTARSAGESDKVARKFATDVFTNWNKLPKNYLDTRKDIPKALLIQMDRYEKIVRDKMDKEQYSHNFGNETGLEASDTYTNKSKKVKLVFYENRSTAQTVKPGQTVKAKKGYGKRTKVRDAKPDEVKQLKAGKWLRTRESGKGPNDPGSKVTKYRKGLAKISRAAKKRKLAASDTPANKYKAFIEEVFGK